MDQIVNKIRDVSQYVTEQDIDEVAEYMDSLRKPGVTPSNVRDRGIDFAELYVSTVIPENRLIQLRVAAYILGKACMRIGIHAEQKRAEKLEGKK
jgi:hypothetical protein